MFSGIRSAKTLNPFNPKKKIKKNSQNKMSASFLEYVALFAILCFLCTCGIELKIEPATFVNELHKMNFYTGVNASRHATSVSFINSTKHVMQVSGNVRECFLYEFSGIKESVWEPYDDVHMRTFMSHCPAASGR